MFNVTLCQIPYQRTAEDAVAMMCSTVANGGGDLFVFPELFLNGYWEGTSPGTSAAAFHQSINVLRDVCEGAGRGLVFGCVYSEGPDDPRLFNAAVYISPDGREVGVHKKSILYGDRESAVFAPGGATQTWTLKGASFALCVCYELEHSEIVGSIVDGNPDILVCISGNMKPLCSDHADALPARATETGKRIVYVNATGSSGELEMCGHSALVAPDGTFAVSLGEEEACVTVRV